MMMIRPGNNDSLNSSIDSRKHHTIQLTDSKQRIGTSVSINNSVDLKQAPGQHSGPMSIPGTPS